MNSISIQPADIKKIVGGSLALGGAASATVSLLALKSVIVLGIASNAIPIIGTIIGLAIMLLGLFYFAMAYRSDTLDQAVRKKEVQPIQIQYPPMPTHKEGPQLQRRDFIAVPGIKPLKPLVPLSIHKVLDKPLTNAEIASIVEQHEAASKTDPLRLTRSDKLQFGSNLVQWALIGATAMGAPASLVLPISAITGLGSEIATFCSLPKNASWFRTALSIPGLSRLLIHYNPWIPGWIPKLMQGISLVNLAQSSISKLSGAWEGFKNNPVKAVKAGTVHLFNLASGAAFAAESAGLINLRPQAEPVGNRPCDPTTEEGCSGPFNRKIRLATVYNNVGTNASRRQAISDRTTANHKQYADKWKCDHDLVTTNLVKGECTNPRTGMYGDCSAYWNKIKYFKDWCATPATPGHEEWAIYADDDAVYTNFNIDPSHAIDQLRGSKDTSFIIATEGRGTRFNPGAVNTGVMIVRKDPRGCEVVDRIWKNRNTITSNNPDCPTFGICKGQLNGDEQGATDRVLWSDAPHLLKNAVTRILARDAAHPKRGNIALNTVYRAGCMTAERPDGSLTGPFDINIHDQRTNPEGVWKEGDWIGQTAGYPLYGQDLSHQPMDKCTVDTSVPVEPIRLKKVEQMLRAAEKTLSTDPRKMVETIPFWKPIKDITSSTCVDFPKHEMPVPFDSREITFGAVYDNGRDPNRQPISDFVNENHRRYAEKWGLKHQVVSDSLVAGKCKTNSGDQADCAPYWNKIQMLRDWLNEEKKPGVEEWRIYADDDMLVTNMGINPAKAIDALRNGEDTSVIVAEDVVDWQRWFFEHSEPNKAVNTGVLIVRKDDYARQFIEEVWDQRTKSVPSPTPDCENIGTCKLQDRTMQEQEAMAIVLRSRPSYVGNVVSVVAPRDESSASRGHIGINTFYRDGCFKKKDSAPFTFRFMDRAENPKGAFRKGDWLTQTAGVPVTGKNIPFTGFGFLFEPQCIDKAGIPDSPVRLNKLQELSKQIVEDVASVGG